jgi:hypothetical protein
LLSIYPVIVTAIVIGIGIAIVILEFRHIFMVWVCPESPLPFSFSDQVSGLCSCTGNQMTMLIYLAFSLQHNFLNPIGDIIIRHEFKAHRATNRAVRFA